MQKHIKWFFYNHSLKYHFGGGSGGGKIRNTDYCFTIYRENNTFYLNE